MFFNKTNTAIFFLLISISACSSNEIGESKDVAQDKIHQKYSVTYDEVHNKAIVFAQFRFGGSNGTTLVLSKPSQVAFDDEIIKVDSSGGSGAYYKLYKPIANFFGKHHFVFTDINNKKFDNDFSFDTFRIVNPPASVSKKQDLKLSFEAAPLQPGDAINVSSYHSDSSFVIEHGSSDGKTIVIPSKQLMRQKTGELKLDATISRKLPLQQNTAEGGGIDIKYSLKLITVKLVE